MGRPPLDYKPVIIQIGDLRLHPVHDADLIDYLAKVPPRQRVRAIKAAMRAGGLTAAAVDLHADDDELTDAAGDFI